MIIPQETPKYGIRGGYDMPFLPEEYILLFNTLTAAEETLAQLRASLMEAQQQAEELYLRRAEAEA